MWEILPVADATVACARQQHSSLIISDQPHQYSAASVYNHVWVRCYCCSDRAMATETVAKFLLGCPCRA